MTPAQIEPQNDMPVASSPRWQRPELLSPAGDWECVKAAVENGADAVYFGLDHFNARMRAANFTAADLPRLMELLHDRGVKGYVTFNILVFPTELEEAQRTLRSMITAGVDAAIVQDVGICRLIRRHSPDFPIHASTQMTITSTAGLAFAQRLGCSMVALARECSLAEIEAMQTQQQAAAATAGTPDALQSLEVFVHGALCVAYSGQCLTSESLGGRSANRGVCAQACRLPYELVCDGQTVELADRRYLLSPQDLAGLEVLPDLVRAGIHTLKIEGRLKSPEYVANITRVYRQALDGLLPQLNAESAPPETVAQLAAELTAQSRYDIEMAFSRGLYTGWFRGVNNQELVHARFGKKRGVYLGKVTAVDRQSVLIDLEGPLKPGDGVVFDAGRPDEPEEGGRVYTINPHGRQTALTFGHRDLSLQRIHAGDRLWKTSDPELEKQIQKTFQTDRPRFQRPIQVEVHGEAGQQLTLIARDDIGHVVQAQSTSRLLPADNQPLDDQRLRDNLQRLGGTPFRLGSLINRLSGAVILPVSELNQMRREVVSQLQELRRQPLRWQWNEPTDPASSSPCWRDLIQSAPAASNARNDSVAPAEAGQTSPELIGLVRDWPQLEAALQAGLGTIYCEFEDLKRYREAVRFVRSFDRAPAATAAIWIVPPRITKPGETWMLQQIHSSEADGYLVRNYDHLDYFAGLRCRGDFSLNIANPLSADYFINQYGLERVTASYDLNLTQLESLLQSAPPAWFEITIHQRMPMFHMEHCVFCAFLSTGTDYRNCGRPCEKHEVNLRDRVGAEHPLKADAGCRNTVFNGRAQTGAEFVDRLLRLGARSFRIEFVNETPRQVRDTIAQYQRLLRGEISGQQLWKDLKLVNHLGVTRGPMDHPE